MKIFLFLALFSILSAQDSISVQLDNLSVACADKTGQIPDADPVAKWLVKDCPSLKQGIQEIVKRHGTKAEMKALIDQSAATVDRLPQNDPDRKYAAAAISIAENILTTYNK